MAEKKVEERIKLHPGNMRWNCEKCESLLGFVDQDNSSVRLKYKDHYVTIVGGKVSVICRRCGFMNTIVDEDFLLFANFSIPLKKILALKEAEKLKEKETLERIIEILKKS